MEASEEDSAVPPAGEETGADEDDDQDSDSDQEMQPKEGSAKRKTRSSK